MAVAEAAVAPAMPPAPARPGFWERSIAAIVDLQILIVAVLIVTFPTLMGQIRDLRPGTQPSAPSFGNPGLELLFGVVYFVYLWSDRGGGRTWGMRVMGLRVTREDGSMLTAPQALIRFGGLLVSCVALFIGVIWVAFDAKKQGWHDKMAGSIVVPAGPALYPAHPVTVTVAPPVSPIRFWAVPIVGILVKLIALIPVYILLAFAVIAAAVVILVAWIPVLVVGRYPGWAFTFLRGLQRWSLRINAFTYGLTDRYPWPGAGPDHPATLALEPPASSSRLWAIPILGLIVKAIVLIPAFFLTTAAGYGVGLAFVILWAPVLVNGSYPAWGYRFVQANLRWGQRLEAYVLGLTDVYPDTWNWER